MPDLIGGFEVDFRSTLGNGRYGMVYRARNVETGEYVAAKQVFIRSAARDLPRIINDVDNMTYVSHENLVRYLHHYDDQGTFWVFVELCDLGDLDQYFAKNNPDRQEYTQLMQQMATAIEFLHESGIVHRDVKPGNILLKSRKLGGIPIVKIGDFGQAKIVDLCNSVMLSFSTLNVGTRIYMAPELLIIVTDDDEATTKCDKSVDIFALGITFFSMICFKTGAERLIPSEDGASRPELACGYKMRMLQDQGKLDEAKRYHEEFVHVKGDAVEKLIRELIQKMINFDSRERVQASDVLSTINDAIMILSTGQLSLEETYVAGIARKQGTRPGNLPVGFADFTVQGSIESQKSAETDTGGTTSDSAGKGSIDSGSMDSHKSNDTCIPKVVCAPCAPDPSTVVLQDSGFSDLQILQEQNLKSVAIFKQKASIEAVRSDSHKLVCAATETARDSNTFTLRIWDINDHQCWEPRDIVVEHALGLESSPESAGVITILEDRLLLRVRLDDDRRQLLAVDSTSGEVLYKTPVYPGRGVAAYCRYKNQILLPDWKESSSIKQLDAMTLKELYIWTNEEVVEPGSVCSSRNRFAVSYKEDQVISVFQWKDLQLSSKMIYTVNFKCKGIQLLPENILTACNWDRRWSVWNENGVPIHYNVKHPQLAYGRKVYPRAIQDPVSGECFVQERVEVHRDWCRMVYNARIATNRLSVDKAQIDNSLLKLNRTISYK